MWFKTLGTNVIIFILVKPSASRSKVVGIFEGRLHVMLQAKPQRGEANKALILYISKIFCLPKSQVFIIKGMASRYKQVSIPWSKAVQLQLDELDHLRS